MAIIPQRSLAQALRTGQEIGMFAEVLPVPAAVRASASPMRFAPTVRTGRWESRVRISSPHRFALEVDGRRIGEGDALPVVDVTTLADGSTERRYLAAAGSPTAPARDRELTVHFRPRPDSTPASAVVRVRILVGYDGAT